MKRSKKLGSAFFRRPTLAVARGLLGKYLVVKHGQEILSGKIVETEAYVGEDDLACHASKGRTPRTETLYKEAGTIYVYLIYGMYHCMNIVTERKDFPSAVLLRAVEPAEGIATMKKRRRTEKGVSLCSGPGKLCQALGITGSMNGEMVSGDKLWIEDRRVRVHKSDVVATTRVAVDYSGPCKEYPWRFYIKDSAFISRK